MSVPASSGPAGWWSDVHPASPSQYRTIAVLALDLLGESAPGSRLDASVTISRLRKTLETIPPPEGSDGIPC